MRAATRAVLLVLALVVASGPARADSAAAQAFDLGRAAFDRSEYELALARFKEAFELDRHDVVRFNIAVCLERLSRFREAAEQYEAAATSAALPADVRERASAKAGSMRAHLGRLEVTGSADASLLLDGRTCRVPCGLDVDPGRYELEIRRPGQSTRRTVEIAQGKVHEIAIEAGALGPPAMAKAAAPRLDARTRAGASSAPLFGPLSVVGGGLVAVGAAGTTLFGLRARSLHEDFERTPTVALADEGDLSRDLANASIGVIVLGAVVVAIDLLLVRPTRAPAPREIIGSVRF